MSLFQRLTQSKSSFHFEVQFHDVTSFYAEQDQQHRTSVSSQNQPSHPDDIDTYYCTCERNSKRYRTKAVPAIPKKSLGTPHIDDDGLGPAAAALKRWHSEDHPAGAAAVAASASVSSPASAAAPATRPASNSSSGSATPIPKQTNSVITFDETLAFGCTLYKPSGSTGGFSKKVFRLNLKCSDKSTRNFKRVKNVAYHADVNLAAFASKGVRHATLVFPLEGKPGPPPGKPPPQLRCTITCMWMNDGAKDKDGYSSCSSKQTSRIGASNGGSNHARLSRAGSNLHEMSINQLSQYAPRNAADARAYETSTAGINSREQSRNTFPVAFYGENGANVWDTQPGTASIYDGFPSHYSDHPSASPPLNTHNGAAVAASSSSSPAAAAASAAALTVGASAGSPAAAVALSVIRASANSASRTNSRATSHNSRNGSGVKATLHANGNGPPLSQQEFDMEVELRQRRRDNEEAMEMKETSQNGADHQWDHRSSISASSPSAVLRPRRDRDRDRERDEDKNNSDNDPVSTGRSSSDNRRSHSSGMFPYSMQQQQPQQSLHPRRPSSEDLYAELASADVIGGLLNANSARDEPASAPATSSSSSSVHSSILATFRHSPAIVASVPRRPSIIQEEPRPNPRGSFSVHPLFAGLPQVRTPAMKQLILDNSTLPSKSKGGGVQRRPTIAPMMNGSPITQNDNHHQILRPFSLGPSSSAVAATSSSSISASPPMHTSSSNTSAVFLSNASLPFASLPLASMSSSTGAPSSPVPVRRTPSIIAPMPDASSSSISSGDDWMSSIRSQLATAPLNIDPASILVSQHPAAIAERQPSKTHARSTSRDSAPTMSLSNQLYTSAVPGLNGASSTSAAALPADGSRSQSAGIAIVGTTSSIPRPALIRNVSTPAQLHPNTSLSQLQIGDGGILLAQTSTSHKHTLQHHHSNPASGPPPSRSVQQISSIPFQSFLNIHRFHEGRFGVIWRADLPAHLLPSSATIQSSAASSTNGTEATLSVVIKVPKQRPGPDEIAELFSFLNLPSHPHVLPFLGLCTDWRSPLSDDNAASDSKQTVFKKSSPEKMFCFVTELQRCSLKELALQLPPWNTVDADSPDHAASSSPRSAASSSTPSHASQDPLFLLQLLHQMALGLSHFHAHRHIHRDISLRNFLLSQSNTVLLCDFGLSRAVDDSTHSNKAGESFFESSDTETALLPLRWLAPESLLSHRFTFASDVFSFGVAAWELITQATEPPYHTVSNMREVVSLVCTGEMRLTFDGKCTKPLEKLLHRCLALTPSRRPLIGVVAATIEQMITQQYANQTHHHANTLAASPHPANDTHYLTSESDEE